ncbi:hypothetical protein ACVW0I_000308 [Bradyrhizobium sp. LM6.11]
MRREPCELARRLAREAEAVCRHYLSNGKRQGRYWLVGDVNNTLAARCLCGSRICRKALPENGPTPQPASMAIFSTSFVKHAACAISGRSQRRRGAF